MLTPSPKILGVDGRKMSKSYNNAVLISDSKEQVAAKVKVMYTDPTKIRVNDKGHPEGCVVYNTHKLYTPEVADIKQRCEAGTLGCVACKGRLIETLNAGLEPIRAERARWETRPQDVKEIVRRGTLKATEAARLTMADVRQAIHFETLSGGAA